MTAERKTQTEKFSFEDYWKNVVGKVTKMHEEIETKLDEMSEFLLDIIREKAVIPEETQIENEQVLVDVPKVVMDFLRAHEKDLGRSVKEYIELAILQTVDSDLGNYDVFDAQVKQVLTNLVQPKAKEAEKP